MTTEVRWTVENVLRPDSHLTAPKARHLLQSLCHYRQVKYTTEIKPGEALILWAAAQLPNTWALPADDFDLILDRFHPSILALGQALEQYLLLDPAQQWQHAPDGHMTLWDRRYISCNFAEEGTKQRYFDPRHGESYDQVAQAPLTVEVLDLTVLFVRRRNWMERQPVNPV